MSKAYTEISAGLTDAIFHAKGNKSKVREHRPKPIDVKAITIRLINPWTSDSVRNQPQYKYS